MHPTLRTALAFCEAWPPDNFPITFYRTPTCPDWELRTAELPADLAAARLVYASGTGLAREPSRATTLEALRRARQQVIFDLDWREVLWENVAAYPDVVWEPSHRHSRRRRSERFVRPAIDPRDVLKRGPTLVIVKRGAHGATVVDARGSRDVPGVAVPVVNGLGAGDASARPSARLSSRVRSR